MDEQRLAAYADGHRRALGVGLPLGAALVTFVLMGGFGAGWGNLLAAGVLAISISIGMKLILDFLASVPRDTPQR
jgi:hypothetical protein